MIRPALTCLALLVLTGTCGAGETPSLVARIKAVGKEGAGNVEAAEAWKELVAKGPAVLPDVLGGLDDAGPVAANWFLRSDKALYCVAESK